MMADHNAMSALLRHSPVEVVFGAGRLEELGRHAKAQGARRILVVTDPGIEAAGHVARGLESLLFGAYRGAVNHTQTFLVMSHDDASGRMQLENDRIRIDWPGVECQAIFERENPYRGADTKIDIGPPSA